MAGMPLGPREFFAAAPHLIYFGLVRPWQSWTHRHSLRREGYVFPPLVPYYQRAVSSLAGAGFFSLVVLGAVWLHSRGGAAGEAGSVIHIYGRQVPEHSLIWSGLLPPAWPSLTSWLLGLVVYAAMASTDLWYSRRCLARGEPHMYFATPRTRQERRWWVALSLAAGVGEELTWRGVQPELIAQMTGALWPAVTICALTFGIGHIRQGWGWVAIVTVFSLACHGLTLATGSLYVAMAVHVAVNITVGLRVADRQTRPDQQ